MDCPTALVSCPTVSARSPRSAVVAPHGSAGCCRGLVATDPWGGARGIRLPGRGGTSAVPCPAVMPVDQAGSTPALLASRAMGSGAVSLQACYGTGTGTG